MDKYYSMLNKFVGTDLARGLALALVLKALIFDVSYATVLLLVPLLGYEGYKLFLKSKKPDPFQMDTEIRKELEAVKTRISALNMEKSMAAASAPIKRHW